MRLTGPGWQGRPGLRRRARLRRWGSALLLGLGVLVGGRAGLDRLAPPTDSVVVASRDLAAGSVLTAGDVRVVERPRAPDAQPAPDAAAVVGQRLASPVRAGEEVTPSRLVGTDLLAGQPSGSRGVWLPAPSADSLTGIGPGSHVDVHVSGGAAPVLRDVVVLARTGATGSPAGLLGADGRPSAGLLLAAPAADAARVLGADLGEVGTFRFALTGR